MTSRINLTTKLCSALVAWSLVACGGEIVEDPTAPTDNDAGDDSGRGGSGAGPGDGAGGVSSAPSGGANGSTGGSGFDAGGSGPSDDVNPPVVDPEFPGVDVGVVPGEPPDGCEDAFDAATGTLTLDLTASVASALISVQQGAFAVNGTTCSDPDGGAVSPDRLQKLSVTGGAEANVVILDFSVEPWGDELFASQGVTLDLGDGADDLQVRGSDGADEYTHGSTPAALVLDLSGDLLADVVATGVRRLTVSLGPGNDSLRAYDPSGALPGQPALSGVRALDVSLVALGGDGDDGLTGGNGNDSLEGGDGDDVLNGLAGDDVFPTGPHDDGADLINGGAGFNQVSYAKRAGDLFLTLCLSTADLGCASAQCDCAADDGSPGENDNLINVTSVNGGFGNDVMFGSPGDDALFGGPGDDQIEGGLGSDVVLGQEGVDGLHGGLDVDICDGQLGETVLDCEI